MRFELAFLIGGRCLSVMSVMSVGRPENAVYRDFAPFGNRVEKLKGFLFEPN